MLGTESAHHAEPLRNPAVELRDLAEELLAENEGNVGECLTEFRDRVELDVELIKALLGREWPRAVETYLRSVRYAAAGADLNKAAKNPPLAERHDQDDKARKRALKSELGGLLWKMIVGDKALALCNRVDVTRARDENGRHFKFLSRVAEALPEDNALVRDHLTNKQAAKLWDETA